ncbi:hypothetical protein BKA66DRAFT_411128 [Pyrenochaeta sp. MPI-SDFR-AT-0127]|nr:hypothetical protein BKA66DRAFT_411128 [Pyrenochaeta sp. MPI-SDFR-AT-0127]
MERVILFAQSVDIERIWIDTESIFQKKWDHPVDKQLGVQIMDVVYHGSEQSNKDNPKLNLNAYRRRSNIKLLILLILSDVRWSRGWIFQEDHLASANMTLLIPHPDRLDKGSDFDFGSITGELRINLMEFRQAVTMFCLACSEDIGQWPLSEILAKAKQYNICNKKIYTMNSRTCAEQLVRPRRNYPNSRYGRAKLYASNACSEISVYPTTTKSVIDDVCSRSLGREEDRLDIVANALQSSARLNINNPSLPVVPETYSLSTVLLALVILQGEILSSSLHRPRSIMDHSLQSFLKALEFTFQAPKPLYEQSFIDRCRFRMPEITERGIKTKGFLFKLLPAQGMASYRSHLNLTSLELDYRDRNRLSQFSRSIEAQLIPEGRKLSRIARAVIEIIIEKLDKKWRDGRLARFLRRHVKLDRRQSTRRDTDPTTSCILEMMFAIYQALNEGWQVRLGRHYHESDTEDPTAIFIMPQHHGWASKQENKTTRSDRKSPTLVFTSWHKGRGPYERETLASLEVSILGEQKDNCSLINHAWVNGVWNTIGEEMRTYCFPLAGITEDLSSSTRTKWKRAKDDYGPRNHWKH